MVSPDAPIPAERPQPGPPSTILVVDDEVLLRDLVRCGMEQAGFRVLEARHGLEAIELLRARRERVDLVLLDMVMPCMDGPEAFRLIRSLDPSLPILLTSGYAPADACAGLAGRAPDGFLPKPFRMSQLVERARELLVGRDRIYTTA